MTEDIDVDDIKKPVVLFDRDVTTIPCFRGSFLYGIGSGFVGGLAYFLFTSKTTMATHIGFSTFVAVTLGYWFHCRWKWSVHRFQYGQLQAVMKKQIAYEGTELDVTNKESLTEVKNEA